MSAIEGRRSVAPPARHRRHLIVAASAATLLLGSAGAAAADPPDYSLTVGIPDREAGPGLIDNRLRTGGGQILSEELLGLGDPSGSRFGAAMLVDDLDDDGFDDMIVGAPGTPDREQKGTVYILFGTSTGISAARAVTVPQPASVQGGDEFGTALSLTFRTEDDGSTPEFRDLWIGAPGHDIGSQGNAGAIYRYTLNASGTPAYVQAITQDSSLVPGTAEAGDRFGEVLAARAGNGTIVGVPGEDIGRAVNAGTVQQLPIDPSSHALIAGRGWNQNTAGVAGTAEANDRFGASMTEYAGVVGIPGEDIGRLKDAGAVQLFTYNQGDPLVPSGAWNQNSPGLPGVAEAGDRFGTSVGIGIYQCELGNSAAVGAPGEDVGSIKDAGSVTLALIPHQGTSFTDCPPQALSQGHGIPGAAEAGDQLGYALGELPGDLNDEEALRDLLLVGVPGEDIGTKPEGSDVGRALVGVGSTTQTVKSYGYQGGNVEGLLFGLHFPSR